MQVQEPANTTANKDTWSVPQKCLPLLFHGTLLLHDTIVRVLLPFRTTASRQNAKTFLKYTTRSL